MSSSYTGYTAAQLFGQGTTYTYDDVIVLPGHINFGAHEASLSLLLPPLHELMPTPPERALHACLDVKLDVKQSM